MRVFVRLMKITLENFFVEFHGECARFEILFLGAIQIICDTFLSFSDPPPHVTFYFFK